MLGDIPVALLDNLGAVALVVLFGIAIGRGWVVTAREHANVLHDRNEWRAESRIKDSQIAEKDKQIRMLNDEVGRTVIQVMHALQQQSDDRRP